MIADLRGRTFRGDGRVGEAVAEYDTHTERLSLECVCPRTRCRIFAVVHMRPTLVANMKQYVMN